jgi:hypothetical protein
MFSEIKNQVQPIVNNQKFILTHLNNFGLWESPKRKIMNFESLKINIITSSTWWAPNKVLKQQICIRNFFHYGNNE